MGILKGVLTAVVFCTAVSTRACCAACRPDLRVGASSRAPRCHRTKLAPRPAPPAARHGFDTRQAVFLCRYQRSQCFTAAKGVSCLAIVLGTYVYHRPVPPPAACPGEAGKQLSSGSQDTV